jgi:Ring finger domain
MKSFSMTLRNRLKSSCPSSNRKKRPRPTSDDDEDIEVLLTAKSESAPTRKQNLGPKLKASSTASTKCLLLILGLTEHDTATFKDLSDIWKSLYQAEKNKAISGDSFPSACREEIWKIQGSDHPFVDRASVLFWLVYLQIARGIQVNVLRQKSGRQGLEARLGEGRNAVGAVSATNSSRCKNAATPEVLEAPSRAKRARLQAPSPPPPAFSIECVICKDPLGAVGLEVTPCAHSFHSGCLDAWLFSQSRENRCCPICKHRLGTYKEDDSSIMQEGVAPSTPAGRSNSVSDNTRTHSRDRLSNESAAKQRERAARLTRLESRNPSSLRPASKATRPPLPPSVATPVGVANEKSLLERWSCSKCTFRNSIEDETCSMCQQNRPGNAQWACPRCTLQNAIECTLCSACCAPSPYTSRDSAQGTTTKSFDDEDIVNTSRRKSPIVAPVTSSNSKPSIISKQKCGACGELGHNRSNATPDNCPSYYDEEEVQRRGKKREQNQRKARETKERITEMERLAAERAEKLLAAETALATLKESHEADEEMRQNELKRLRQRQKRAEKQASK